MSAFRTWKVTGEKVLADGHTVTLLACSWGATEGHARKAFQRLQEIGPKADVFGKPYRQWPDSDLVFTPDAGGAS